MAGRYPEIEPYDHGMLDVGDGNRLYWETCGNPAGTPAVVLHGGPGSGCGPGLRRLFDPAAYRVVLFDQRQCGRSTPSAADPGTDLTTNTTHHLLADLERLRIHLGIHRWLVFGGSWGAVLGLAYAEAHPDQVSAMVLTGVATGRRAETDLLTRGLGRVFPAAYRRFRAGAGLDPDVDPADDPTDLAAAYAPLLADPDPRTRQRAADDWCAWEAAIVPTAPAPRPLFATPQDRLTFARIVTHYFANGCWLEDGVVLARAASLASIPGVLVQGTLDLSNLIGTPWELHRAWPGSRLVLVDDAGHETVRPTMEAALLAATDGFRDVS